MDRGRHHDPARELLLPIVGELLGREPEGLLRSGLESDPARDLLLKLGPREGRLVGHGHLPGDSTPAPRTPLTGPGRPASRGGLRRGRLARGRRECPCRVRPSARRSSSARRGRSAPRSEPAISPFSRARSERIRRQERSPAGARATRTPPRRRGRPPRCSTTRSRRSARVRTSLQGSSPTTRRGRATTASRACSGSTTATGSRRARRSATASSRPATSSKLEGIAVSGCELEPIIVPRGRDAGWGAGGGPRGEPPLSFRHGGRRTGRPRGGDGRHPGADPAGARERARRAGCGRSNAPRRHQEPHHDRRLARLRRLQRDLRGVLRPALPRARLDPGARSPIPIA